MEYADNSDDAVSLAVYMHDIPQFSTYDKRLDLAYEMNSVKEATNSTLGNSQKICFVIDTVNIPECADTISEIDDLKADGMDFAFIYYRGNEHATKYRRFSTVSTYEIASTKDYKYRDYVVSTLFAED